MRKSVLPWLACALVALVAIPALASGAASRSAAPSVKSALAPAATVKFKTASASAADGTILVEDNFFQDADGDPGDSEISINAGEKVSFIQQDGHQPHNVLFTGAQPASCTQLTGQPMDSNTIAPMPDAPLDGSWTGECRFTSGGSYAFVCAQHPDMVGKVEVEGTATPTPTPTVTVTPTVTPTRPGIVARDGSAPRLWWFQDAQSSDPFDNSITVNAGATVDFSYPVGTSAHNVVFSGAQPTSCVQKTGVIVYPDRTAPLPRSVLPAAWTGECVFQTPGTYSFLCGTHPEMTGTVVVESTAPTPPETTIDSGPQGTTNSASANFTFSSNQPAATFECKLDTPGGPGTYAACSSPAALTTTTNGSYTFSVRAVLAGTPDQTPATRSFTVDTGPPDTTINSGPSGPTSSTSATFQFSGTEVGSTFECRLDSAAYAPCTSPQSHTGLAQGEHTFSVRARDAAGNVDPSPATRTFTVDTVAPDTTIDSGPTGTIGATSPQFTFSSEAGATFECRLDGPGGATGTFGACTSPRTVGPLADGTYTFHVRARDAAGNTDTTPATRTFTVETSAPDTAITGGPTGLTNATNPSFTFTSTKPGSTFECRLDTPAGNGTFAACSSPQAYTTTVNGAYTFHVRARDAAGNADASPATRTFTVDTSAPNTTIDSGPSGTVNTASPQFTFSSEAGATFECRLDGPGGATGGYQTCTSPRILGSLADGSYTFLVRATDAAGNVDSTPASRAFTVDATAPNTSIDSGPSGTITSASATFTFSGEAGATFECRLDSAAFAPCTSPQAYTNLADGEHTFAVRAKDAAGNVDATPATGTFTVDTAAPDTTIDSGPTGIVTTGSASFTFSGSELGSTFECRMDSAAYAPCNSPQNYTNLTNGEHTFAVRARDAAGNVDPTPATRTFSVDFLEPDTTIDSGPTGTITNASPQFAFSSSEPGSTFQCRLDGPGTATGSYASCTSPRTLGPLVDGTYTFLVRATDPAGNLDPLPATRTFTVETSVPDTSITSGPTGTTNNAAPSFAFESTKPNSTFECRLDSAAFAPCTSPQAYSNLTDGEHTFAVRAKDANGVVDATPATRTFTVDTAAPDTTIDSGPSGTINTTSATFAFSSEAGATFECRLDSAAFAPCTSPQAYSHLVEGDHTFSVRAKDAAGNVDTTPATRTFRVELDGDPTVVTEDTEVSGTVPTILGLSLAGPAAFPPFMPGVSADYNASLTALITSSAPNAQLSVVDASGSHPGRMVNGAYVLTDPLQVRATNAAQPDAAFAPLTATPRQLLAYSNYIASDPVTIGFRQTVRANEALLAGAYEKTLTFTLSTTTP
jgi:plastocyanin